VPWHPTTTRRVAMAAFFFVSRGTLKQRAHLDLISTFHPSSKLICCFDIDFSGSDKRRDASNVYRKLGKVEMTLHLRIAESTEPAPSSAAVPRSRPGELFGMRRRLSRTLARRRWLSLSLAGALLFAWNIDCSWACGQSEPAADKATSAAWNLAKSDPHALVQSAIENELKNSYGHRPPARYLLRKKTRNVDTTKEIVETSQGGVARLVAIGNKTLNAKQRQAELQRLRELASDRAAQEHRRHNEQRDAARVTSVMRLLPDAFINRFEGPAQMPNGTAIRMSFTPNPHFSPPTLESRVLTGIRGEIWIDPTDLRVIRIEGRLFRQVDYGWGILGTLYPGGTVSLDQIKTPECGWRLSHLRLDMTGKELMFKSLRVFVDETATNYRPVPPGWKYTDAIDWLLHMAESSTTANLQSIQRRIMPAN
jgi:hypothetical protein